jgi:hypothetical protein
MTRIKILFIIGIFLSFVYSLSTMSTIEGYRGDTELCGIYKANSPERKKCVDIYNGCGYQECIDKSPIDRSICLLKVGTCYSDKSMDELRQQNTTLGKTIQSLDSKLSATIKMMTATTSKTITSASNAMKSAFKSIPTAPRTTKVSLAVSKPKAKKRR